MGTQIVDFEDEGGGYVSVDYADGTVNVMLSARLTCWHVTTTRGHVYGVATWSKRDALERVDERLRADGADLAEYPRTAVAVGTWDAPFGAVLAY